MFELCVHSAREPRLICDLPPAAQGLVQVSTGGHDSGTCSCFNFSKNKKMPIGVRSQQRKKSRDFWPRNSICHPSGSSLAQLPLAISERSERTYLEPDDAAALIAWAAQRFSNAIFVVYEQMRPQDAFGEFSPSVESCGCGLGPSPVRLG